MKRYTASTVVFLLVLGGNLRAANYYCSPAGSMADSGTSVTSPWGTLQEVFAEGKTFLPGDTLYLMSGNQGFPVISVSNTSDVVITRYKNNNPILNRIDFNGASHWVLENVKVYTSGAPPRAPILEHPVYPLSGNTLLRIMNGSSYITLLNCYIYSIENSSAWTASDWNYKAWNGVVVEGSCSHSTLNACHVKNTNFALELSGSNYTTVVNSLVENFCGDAIIPGNNNVIEYNTFRDSYKTNGNHCDLVQGFSVSSLQFRGNQLIARSASHSSIETDCQGIGFFDGTFTNCLIENNLVSVETYHGITIFNANNCRIINNTLIDMTSGGLVPWMYITGTGNLVRNNISSSMNTIEGTADHNIVLFRSKYINYFRDPGNGDYHLKAGSPAIDAGIDTEAPVIDLDKNVRPKYAITDAGAYEYDEGPDTLSPSAPSLLAGKNPGPSGFTLTWAASTDNIRVSGYDVYLDGVLDTTVAFNTVTYTRLADTTTYTLTVIAKDASDNFSTESDPVQLTTLSLISGMGNDLSEDRLAVIYPNPVMAGGEIIVHFDNWKNQYLTIEIADMDGKILDSQSVCTSTGKIAIKSNFNKGIYMVKMSDGQKKVIRKLIVK